MDEIHLQRIRNIISKCPRNSIIPWSQLKDKNNVDQENSSPTYDPIKVDKVKTLVKDFLEVGTN